MEYSFVIRRAELADAPAIQEIMGLAFQKYKADAQIPSEVAALSETAEEICRDIENHYVYVAWVDGVAVGSLRIAIFDDGTAYLTRFGVRSDYSNMGVGKALMALVDKLMQAEGVHRLTLHTASKYRELIRFYYGRGFYIESTSTERGYIRALLVKEY